MLRALDLALAAARLWLLLRLVGADPTPMLCLLLASAGILVKLTGLTPAGLGLSEWAQLAVASAAATVDPAALAAALLIDRALEVAVVSASGAWGLAAARRRYGGGLSPTSEAQPAGGGNPDGGNARRNG